MSLNNKEITSSAGENQEQLSIEDLFVTYKTPIYQFVYRYCQDVQLSMDIVQDTFVRFHKYQVQFDENKSSLKTYLFRMAYQIMANRLKRRNSMKKLFPFLYQQNHQLELSLEDKLSIQAAIQQLPDEQRAVILLTYYHDLPQKEISKILEIPIGTVKSRLHASLKKLKVLLEVPE
ncbi:RNA polymerase sigma factor [Bacillus sp. ISL-55]|uniref:RNA polymerase sigma factor n=1 Tax=Bacillus sp. ISL-55 TaxID=2819134 RepID=UPI001BE940B9|nr:RNA polymerase sigma factor [Bacillus sp. ISL-55]MBT2691747.1 RNA polymerase sigma factor [Bacillus sp. ISL-55]